MAALSEYLKRVPDVYVGSPGEVILRPKDRLEPDILVFRTPSLALPWEMVEKLLAVEVASPSSRIYDRDFKRPAYLALGVREYWRVGPDDRTVTGSARDRPEAVYSDRVRWQPDPSRALFELDLEETFRGVP